MKCRFCVILRTQTFDRKELQWAREHSGDIGLCVECLFRVNRLLEASTNVPLPGTPAQPKLTK
jgi:hypothetical protein